jgi:hypothetical protein
MSYWRQQAAPIIERVIREIGMDDMKKLRKALHDAYPFGERKYHPYKIWCAEVKRQVQGHKAPVYVSMQEAEMKPACKNCRHHNDDWCELDGRTVRDLEFCRLFIPKALPRESTTND